MWTVQSKPGCVVSLSIGVLWTSSSVATDLGQNPCWVVRHTMISYATSLSLSLLIQGVLGTRWCAENRDCYFKYIRSTESLHGKDLRIQVNLSRKESPLSLTQTLQNLEHGPMGKRKKFTSIWCWFLLILDFVSQLYFLLDIVTVILFFNLINNANIFFNNVYRSGIKREEMYLREELLTHVWSAGSELP